MSAEGAMGTAMAGAHRGNIWRSIGAVLAGFVAIVILSLGTDVVLHVTKVFPPWEQRVSDGLFLLATVYRTIYCIAGSYLAARIAPRKPMQHAMALGALGLIVSTAGALVTWNHEPSLGPHWYPVALIVTALPCAWLGGKLRALQV